MLKLLLLKVILLCEKPLNLLSILFYEKKNLKKKKIYFARKNEKMHFTLRKSRTFNTFFPLRYLLIASKLRKK